MGWQREVTIPDSLFIQQCLTMCILSRETEAKSLHDLCKVIWLVGGTAGMGTQVCEDPKPTLHLETERDCHSPAFHLCPFPGQAESSLLKGLLPG